MYKLDNKLLDIYNLSMDKQLITYSEYLEIKQKLKENGAKFGLNLIEFNELLDYHLYSNELLYINENNKITKDDTVFKNVLKKLVLDLCSDIILNYDSRDFELINEVIAINRRIIDNNNGIVFTEHFLDIKLLDPSKSFNYFEILNKTHILFGLTNSSSPGFFMHEKITNDKIYDLANHIISEEMYININESFKYLPVFKINKAKKVLKLDDNNKYIGDAMRSNEIREFIDDRFELYLNNGYIAKEIASSYFSNKKDMRYIKSFVKGLINDIANTLSNDKLSLNNFNPNNEELNILIDNKIDDFIFNFKLRSK